MDPFHIYTSYQATSEVLVLLWVIMGWRGYFRTQAFLLFLFCPGTHFTNEFSITIQIRWKIYLDLIQLLVIISQQNLAHATSALDSLQHKGVSKCWIYLVHQVIKS